MPPFQLTLIQDGILPVSITMKNLAGNVIHECFHGTIKNQSCTIIHSNPPQNIGKSIDSIDSAIASTIVASRAAVHQTLGVSPGLLTFQHDMLHSIPILDNFEVICQNLPTNTATY
jgi:hypothetical protein